MRKILLLPIVTIFLFLVKAHHKPLLESIVDDSSIDCDTTSSQLNLLPWFQFDQSNQCLQIIVDEGVSMPIECLRVFQNITIYVRALAEIVKQNIDDAKLHRTVCENFVIFMENKQGLARIFTGNYRRFYPFTYVFIVFYGLDRLDFKRKPQEIVNYINDNVILAYILEHPESKKKFFSFSEIANMLTRTIHILPEFDTDQLRVYFQKEFMSYRVFNRFDANRQFRISMHECIPNVIYLDEEEATQ